MKKSVWYVIIPFQTKTYLEPLQLSPLFCQRGLVLADVAERVLHVLDGLPELLDGLQEPGPAVDALVQLGLRLDQLGRQRAPRLLEFLDIVVDLLVSGWGGVCQDYLS